MKRKTADQSISPFEVEDFASAFIRLKSGGTLMLETSWAAFRSPTDLIDFSVLGTDGGAELKAVGATKASVGDLHVYRDVDGEIADYAPTAEPCRAHAGVVENFVRVLRTRDEWSAEDGSLALERARVIDTYYHSPAEKREVTVE